MEKAFRIVKDYLIFSWQERKGKGGSRSKPSRPHLSKTQSTRVQDGTLSVQGGLLIAVAVYAAFARVPLDLVFLDSIGESLVEQLEKFFW